MTVQSRTAPFFDRWRIPAELRSVLEGAPAVHFADNAATLVTGVTPGTIGDELVDAQGLHDLLFVAASEVQFDRITDAFTAGAGFACIPVIATLTA